MGGLGVGLRLTKLVGVKRGAQPGQGPEGAPLGPGPSLGGPPQCILLVPPTGETIKRVKPKRSTSFFSRQLSVGQGSYTVVQPADSLEQG